MEFEEIASNLVLDKSGIYFSKSDSDISYPEDGNESCMQLEENSFWFKHRNDIIAEGVKAFNETRTFFDVGGGNGFVAKRIQEEGKNVVLVEPGKKGAYNAQKRGVKTVVCSTLENAGFKKGVVESIGMFDVVEHIENDLSFMKKSHEYLKKGGKVYITVPAHKILWSKEDDAAGHFKRYTLKSMEELLTQAGFKIEYSTYFFSVLPFPIFLFRTIPSLLGINKESNNLDQHKDDHSEKKGLASTILNKIWSWELSRVVKRKKIIFGGSCFVIASK